MATTLTSTQQTNVIKAVVGMFGAAPGGYMDAFANYILAGHTVQQMVQDWLANSNAFKNIYSPALTSAQFADKFVTNLVGSEVTDATQLANAKTWIAGKLNAGETFGQVVWDALTKINGVTSTSTLWYPMKQALDNKTTVATYYTITKANTSKDLTTLQSVVSSVTHDTTTVTTAETNIDNGSITTGQTFSLTSGVDTLTGTSGNDTFIADNSNTSMTSAADSINGGAGTDTLKIYAKAGTATVLPTLSNVETLYLNNDNSGLDVSGVSGLTSLVLDAQAGSATYTLKGQAVTVENNTAGITTTLTDTSSATLNVTANGYGKAGTANGITLSATDVATTMNLASTGAASVLALTDGANKVATLNISGDQSLTLTGAMLSQSAMKTINAGTATGAVSVDASTAVTDKAFAFTGGTGNDTLTVKAAEFATLTAGSQLDGGAGTDTLVINDTTPVYAKLNAVKNFEVLKLGTTGATVDIAQLTSFNKFAVAAGNLTETFNNALSTSTFAIDNTSGNTGTVIIANKVGETGTTVDISNTSGVSKTLAALTLTGVTNVALSSTGAATKAGGVNVITTLNNADNSNITVTGDTALTITNALAATTTGSKVDASALTGALTVTGSAKGDILIGGSAADSITSGAVQSTLTGNGGADSFMVGSAVYGAAKNIDNITDFTVGTDKLYLANKGTETFTATAVNVTTATTLAQAEGIAASSTDGSTNGAIKWFQYGGNTYVVEVMTNNGAGLSDAAATDLVVKLTGTLDLSHMTLDNTGALPVIA